MILGLFSFVSLDLLWWLFLDYRRFSSGFGLVITSVLKFLLLVVVVIVLFDRLCRCWVCLLLLFGFLRVLQNKLEFRFNLQDFFNSFVALSQEMVHLLSAVNVDVDMLDVVFESIFIADLDSHFVGRNREVLFIFRFLLLPLFEVEYFLTVEISALPMLIILRANLFFRYCRVEREVPQLIVFHGGAGFRMY